MQDLYIILKSVEIQQNYSNSISIATHLNVTITQNVLITEKASDKVILKYSVLSSSCRKKLINTLVIYLVKCVVFVWN